MDVKQSGFARRPGIGFGNLGESENAAVQKVNNITSIMELLDYFEKWLNKNEIAFDEEQFNKMRSFLEEMAKVTEQNRAAREQLNRDLIAMKKRLVKGMIEIVRGLNSKLYTKDSWRAAMRDVGKGVNLFAGNQEPTRRQLETVLRYLRSGVAKLEPALSSSLKGREHHREEALSKFNRIGNADAECADKKLKQIANSETGIIDLSVGGDIHVATGFVVLEGGL